MNLLYILGLFSFYVNNCNGNHAAGSERRVIINCEYYEIKRYNWLKVRNDLCCKLIMVHSSFHCIVVSLAWCELG